MGIYQGDEHEQNENLHFDRADLHEPSDIPSKIEEGEEDQEREIQGPGQRGHQEEHHTQALKQLKLKLK